MGKTSQKAKGLVARLVFHKSRNPAARKRPVLVGIPGGPGLSSETLSGLARVSRWYDVALIDPPGTWGGRELRHPTFEKVVRSIEVEISLLRRPTVILGHSFGGVYLTALAATRLPIVGMIFLCTPLSKKAWDAMNESYWRNRNDEVADAARKMSSAPGNSSFRDWLASYGELYFRGGREDKARKILLGSQVSYHTFNSFGGKKSLHSLVERTLPDISVPKLFLGAENDLLVSSKLMSRDARAFGGGFVEISRSAHFPSIDQPASLAKSVRSFMQNLVGGSIK